MQTFTMSEVGRKLGKVKRSAQQAPVMLTTRGRGDLVVMTAERYRELTRHEPTALYAHELTDRELDLIADTSFGSGPIPLADDDGGMGGE